MSRLAYLLKKFPRLSETFILNELLAQEHLGQTIHVFSRRKPDDEPRHPQLAGLEATVEVLPSHHQIDPWGTLFSQADHDEELFTRLGEIVRSASEWSHPRFPSLLAEALYLLRRTRELGIGHVHAHFATDSAVVAMLLRDLGGPTYSLTAHAKDIYRNTVQPAVLERLCDRARFVVTVCDANVEYMCERLTPRAAEHVRRLYNGIDLSDFAVPEAATREEGHILAVGRLVEKKGFHVLLEAIALLRERGVECHLSLLGAGDERERLEQLVATLGLDDHAQLLGALDLSRVRELMRRATVLCQPCLIGADGNRDALPTVLLEALACGLPSVSTPVTGIPEILDHGRAGLIVPQNDARATADAVARLLAAPAERARIARHGRERAEALFDRRRTSTDLFDWFTEALREAREPCESHA